MPGGFGGGAGGVIFFALLSKAEAIAPTRIRATFSNAVRQGDGTPKGSAFDPRNYTLTAITPGVTAPALVDAFGEDVDGILPAVAILATIEPLVAGATYQLSASGVRAINGVPLASGSKQFLGVGFAAEDPNPTEAIATGIDIDDATESGDWQLDTGGDVKMHSGIPMIQKLIERRITTAPGAFRHLPAYGLSIDVAKLVTSAELRRVSDNVRSQVLLEPDVLTASARVSLDQKGVLTVGVKAVTKRGQTFALETARG